VLAMHFLRKYAKENGKEIASLADDALLRLSQYSWPANVRELESAIGRAVVVCTGDQLRAIDLGPTVVPTEKPADGVPVIPGASLFELERYAILRTLEHTGGSTSRAAEILGISSRKIQYRLHEYQGGTRTSPASADEADTLEPDAPRPTGKVEA